MKKTFIVVMLPTEKASIGCILSNGKDYLLGICTKPDYTSSQIKPQHLYIISDEEPKEGDIGILDWEGNLNPDDIRVGTVEKISPNFEIRNQYGNLSIVPNDGRFPNNKKYKVISTTDKSLIASTHKQDEIRGVVATIHNIPESFIKDYIKSYNESKPITEVQFEMDAKLHNGEIIDSSYPKEFIEALNKIKTINNEVIITKWK